MDPHAAAAVDRANTAAEDGASTSGVANTITSGVATHGGQYTLYNVFGTSFEISAKYVSPIRPVGRGAYGMVCSAMNSETKKTVAVKKISNAFDKGVNAKRTLKEIKLLRHMEHENVIPLLDIIRPPVREEFNDVYIVYQLMDTDLHQIIRSRQTLSETHYQYFLYQILRGLKFIHSANILHRDLKPSNLLLDENCDLRICDFGLARAVSETTEAMTEYVVTRWYRAPELLLSCNEYTAAIDVWSVGCIFMELLHGETLFPGHDYAHQIKLIMQLIGSPDDSDLGFLRNDNARRYLLQLQRYERQPLGKRYANTNSSAIDLVEKMLVFDPFKRITVEEALSHPYLANYHDATDEPTCRPFQYDFELSSFTEAQIKEMIMVEALAFNPLPNLMQ